MEDRRAVLRIITSAASPLSPARGSRRRPRRKPASVPGSCRAHCQAGPGDAREARGNGPLETRESAEQPRQSPIAPGDGRATPLRWQGWPVAPSPRKGLRSGCSANAWSALAAWQRPRGRPPSRRHLFPSPVDGRQPCHDGLPRPSIRAGMPRRPGERCQFRPSMAGMPAAVPLRLAARHRAPGSVVITSGRVPVHSGRS